MQSDTYRKIVKGMSSAIIKKNFPGLKKDVVENTAREIAINIHARLYGANVNGVESPLWRDDNKFHSNASQPNVDAKTILETWIEYTLVKDRNQLKHKA